MEAKKYRRLLLFLLSTSLAISQEDFTQFHAEDFAPTSNETTLPPSDIHRIWRSMSHWADESDDDSSIELVDVKALASRKQILMVVSAGIPKCVTLAVFTIGTGYPKLYPKIWQEDHGSDNFGFCDNLGIPVEVDVTKDGLIEVSTAVYPESEGAAQAVVRKYVYGWNGKTYGWIKSRNSLKTIAAR